MPGTPAEKTAGPASARELALAFNLALRVTGNAALAEDAVQDAFVRLLAGARPGAGLSPPTSHLLRAVHSCAVDLLRNEGARRRREEEGSVRASSRPESPAGLAGARELAEAARAALAELPGEMRVAVALCCEQGLGQDEAAEIAGVPRGTMARRLQRGLERLREILAARGFAAAAPAALGAALGAAGVPSAPASLAAKVAEIAGRRLTAPSSSAAPARGAAVKGGLAMKIIAGVVLAGALAGIMGLIGPIGPMGSPPAPAGKPAVEHFAFAVGHGSLDGPRRESMGHVMNASCDAQGNIFFFGGTSLRVVRVDGDVETVAADEWSRGLLKLDEGPAAFIGNLFTAGGIGNPVTQVYAQGNPLEGGDKGLVIVSAGSGDGHEKCIYKIWKNKEKQDRWWFKVLIGRGKGVPTAAGQSVAAGEARFSSFPAFSKGGDGKLYLMDNGNIYRYDDDKETLTCIMVPSAYAGVERFGNAVKYPNNPWIPDGFLVGEDGAVYLDFYQSTYPLGGIVRVSADGKKAEWVIKSGGRAGTDGPGLATGWFCGPQFRAYVPGGNVFLGAIDEAQIRRWKDGRVASLCRDGQFRECTNGRGPGGGGGEDPAPYDKFTDGGLPGWGRGWVVGGKDFWYQFYHMGGGSRFIWRIGPVDFNRPTTGPLLGGK